jgi:hypothetical protein
MIYDARINDYDQIAFRGSSGIYVTDRPEIPVDQPVPEPSSLILLGAALPALAWKSRRKAK